MSEKSDIKEELKEILIGGAKSVPSLTGVRAKTRDLLVETAMRMFEQGRFPSITELAVETKVSRATAYRYFPTQSSLISLVVKECLGPILSWQPNHPEAEGRILELLQFAYPRMFQHEGALRAALKISLEQWAEARSMAHRRHERYVRGNRKHLLSVVTEPLQGKMSPELIQRVIYSFSLIYGSEVFLVFKDIWKLENQDIQEITEWIAKAIMRQAKEDAGLADDKLPE